ncbi:DNA polymerase I [Psittacicella hinzii]|uniref:DNA polymerase I n=1 Tax=Psittacicella hinzii TaxID=2028575 RepID=A0A3A1YRZ0_9GAMM|nr:DNA polymerase I [Psittacicella hinzii]RIY40019.1 DNA polymerase I [Psittacicella hinzii]
MFDQTLYIIDGTALIFRNYHVFLDLYLNSKKQDTGAINGTITSLNALWRNQLPENIVVVFDPKSPSFRQEIYSEYKGHRASPDEQLKAQFEPIIKLIKAMGFPVRIIDGYEADDVIGTIAKYHSAKGHHVIIESRDKDFIQLIDEHISLSDEGKSSYDLKNAHTKFGVPIEYTIDFLALCGDSADNIPGVKNVGEKSAAAIINGYGGLEDIYRAIDNGEFTKQVTNLRPETLAKRLLEGRENAFLSYKLATIYTQVPLENIELEDFVMQDPDVNKILQIVEEYELNSLRSSLMANTLHFLEDKQDLVQPGIAAYHSEHGMFESRPFLKINKTAIKHLTPEERQEVFNTGLLPDGTPASEAPASSRARANSKTKSSKSSKGAKADKQEAYICTEQDLALLASTEKFAVDLTNYSDKIVEQQLINLSSVSDELPALTSLEAKQQVFSRALQASPLMSALAQAAQVSLLWEFNPLHKTPVALKVLVESQTDTAAQEANQQALAQEKQVAALDSNYVRPAWQTEFASRQVFSLSFEGVQELLTGQIFVAKEKSAQYVTENFKAFVGAFKELVVLPLLDQKYAHIPVLVSDLKDLAHICALDLATVQQVGANVHDLKVLAYTRNSAVKDTNIAGYAKAFTGLDFTPIKYLKTKVDLEQIMTALNESIAFMPVLYSCCKTLAQSSLYAQVEQPLWKYLYAMEVNGVKVDYTRLKAVAQALQAEIAQVEAKVYELAGQEFNINSPKQTGQILFEKLMLPDMNNGSTSAEALRELSHPIIEPILEYRSLTTIISTHVLPLIELAKANKEQMIHTTFQQTQVVTGRLSSQDPNLQNVPARSDIAKEIRASFVAQPGYKIVSFDYSQIELRVSACLSQDEHMLEAFAHGEDIHARTASKLFNVALYQVEYKQRQIAKAINFGLNYGKTAYSLSIELGISRQDAKAYIDSYFETYPSIKGFIDKTINKASSCMYVQTIEGRVIPLPRIQSTIRPVAEAEKRNATNYPIQGSAAEIIKIAMVALNKAITEKMPEVLPLLQVHDELVFSIPEHLIYNYVPQIKQLMEECVSLPGVNLLVEFSVGDHWKK